MITKENKCEKICSFYASDYHLEMIMLPYINKKIEENSKIIIMTQRDLKKTIEVVISKINLSKERKKEILNIDWSSEEENKLEEIKKINSNEELIVFVIGELEYIKDINTKLRKKTEELKMKVVDCYSLEEVQENMIEIISEHTAVLNTKEKKEINENY